jgi:hypothetical protein
VSYTEALLGIPSYAILDITEPPIAAITGVGCVMVCMNSSSSLSLFVRGKALLQLQTIVARTDAKTGGSRLDRNLQQI